jgi:hypothetical protein
MPIWNFRESISADLRKQLPARQLENPATSEC